MVDIWQHKAGLFRKLAKGWSANLEAFLRKHKNFLMEEYVKFDIQTESSNIFSDERNMMDIILVELSEVSKK